MLRDAHGLWLPIHKLTNVQTTWPYNALCASRASGRVVGDSDKWRYVAPSLSGLRVTRSGSLNAGEPRDNKYFVV